MFMIELEFEIVQVVESNLLLDWVDGNDSSVVNEGGDNMDVEMLVECIDNGDDWVLVEFDWSVVGSGGSFDDDDDVGSVVECVVEIEMLVDYLLWQLYLLYFFMYDCSIGVVLIDVLDDDGYLCELLVIIVEILLLLVYVDEDEIFVVLYCIQCFDLVGVVVCMFGECLQLQLDVLFGDIVGLVLVWQIVVGLLEWLLCSGVVGLVYELKQLLDEVEIVVVLLCLLDLCLGIQIVLFLQDIYVVFDVVVWWQNGIWCVVLVVYVGLKVVIYCGYEQLICCCGEVDVGYLCGQLQEVCWLLKGLQQCGEILLWVVCSLIYQQVGFFEFGEQVLCLLILCEIVVELGLYELMVLCVIVCKYVCMLCGMLLLCVFFVLGIDIEGGGEVFSIVIQVMIWCLIDDENLCKLFFDVKLVDLFKLLGILVV